MPDHTLPPPLLDVRGVTCSTRRGTIWSPRPIASTSPSCASDRFVLLGPSGCGKSTLLKAVGGYMAPTEGEIRAQGRARSPGPAPTA